MKTWTSKLVLALVATASIVACSKKSNNNAAAPVAGVAGTCALDAAGNCVGGVPYQGYGSFTGNLQVVNYELLRQLMISTQLCASHYRCQPTQFVRVTQDISGGQGFFRLQVQGIRNRISRNAMVYNHANGFQLVANVGYQAQTMIYPPQPIAQEVVQTTNTPDVYGNMTTSIIFRGAVVATGQSMRTQQQGGGYYY